MQKKHFSRDGLYTLYDKNDNFVIEGTVKELCEYIGVCKSCISKAVARGSRVRGKYYIYYVGKDEDDDR